MSTRSLYSQTIRPFRRFMCLIGILPMGECCSEREMNCSTRTRKWFHFVRATLQIIAGFIIIFFTGLMRYFKLKVTYFPESDLLSAIMDWMGFFTLTLVHVVIQIESAIQANYYDEIFQIFEEMIAIMRTRLGVAFDRGELKLRCYLLFGFHIVYMMIVAFMTILLRIESRFWMAWTTTMYSEIVLKAKTIEFCIFAVIVMTFAFEICAAAKELAIELQVSNFDPWPKRKILFEKIYVLQELHGKLWSSVRAIENYCEWSLAGLFLKIFLDLTLLSYWVHIGLDNRASDPNLILNLCLMIVQMVTLIVVTGICSICEMTDKKFKTLLHDINTEHRNVYLSSCLREISLQLIHEPIEFSAGGFMTVNANTLGNFLFSVITYTVILIQFRLAV